MSDLLKAIAESWGCEVSCRYQDMVNLSCDEIEEDGDAIALEIIEKYGLKGKSTDGFYETESDSVA